METLIRSLAAMVFITLSMTANAQSTDLDMSGDMRWETVNGGSSVRIEVERITNRSTSGRSGTIHIKMRATSGPDIFGPGYTLADVNLGDFASNNGTLAGGSSFTDIQATRSFTPPPAGTYYTHFFIAEYPDLNTAIDHVTFPGTTTFGGGGGGGGGGGNDGDDHRDTFGGASTLAVNGNRSGQLEVNGDVDMFRIDVSQSGTLRLSTTGSTDTFGEFFDASQTRIASNDDGDFSDFNFSIESRVSAGTYYLRVSGFNGSRTGPYTVHADFTADTGNTGGNDNNFGGNDENSSGGGSFGLLTLFALLLARRWPPLRG
jgi:hypothetical protein